MPALSGEFRVTAIDLPGFGSSHRDARLILDEVPAQVDALLGELGIERAHVMGHSMGGLVAGGLAAEHPQRVDRLVLKRVRYYDGWGNLLNEDTTERVVHEQ